MSKQRFIGSRVMGMGQLLLFAIFILGVIDISGIGPQGLAIPLRFYFAAIFTGVIMQFVGSAIPHMKFSQMNKPKGLKG